MKFLNKILRNLGYVPNTVTRNLTCAWCGKDFTWSGYTIDNHPRFCSDTHSNKARKARKKRQSPENYPKSAPKAKPAPEPIDMSKVGRCPTPFKETHRTWEDALTTIKRVDPSMHPYRCPCGAIHIGHNKKARK